MIPKPVATLAFVMSVLVLPLLAPRAAAAQEPEQISMYAFGETQHIHDPNGRAHDAIAPSNVVLKVGVPVTVTVTNYSGPHTITAPGLKIDVIITPAITEADKAIKPTVTTFTFTPTKKGNFRWYCRVPCDEGQGFWAMSQGYGGPAKEGFMAGEFIVI